MGLAYEIVINSNPCISYLMEENTMAMQALVIAHAAYGHNSFFKGNLPVPDVDGCGVDHRLPSSTPRTTSPPARSATASTPSSFSSTPPCADEPRRRPLPPPSRKSLAQELSERKEREAYAQQQVNDLWRTLPRHRSEKADDISANRRFPEEPQENLLYFIEKNAPLLEPWQRELVRIVRKIAQYFYPQRQSQVMNEGWATFWHYKLLNTMYDEGWLTDGDDRVAEVAHQRGPTSRASATAATAASTPTRWASRCTTTSSASARTRPRRTASGSRAGRLAVAAGARPRDAQLQRRASSAST